jgi:hypothetical protein
MRAIRPSKQRDPRLEKQKSTVEGFERLHVQITQQQYRKLKRLAYEGDTSLAEVVRHALNDWLTKQE